MPFQAWAKYNDKICHSKVYNVQWLYTNDTSIDIVFSLKQFLKKKFGNICAFNILGSLINYIFNKMIFI